MNVTVAVAGTSISLTQNEFLTSGGEGNIYVRGQTAYKIYHDPHKVLPSGKFTDLSVLNNPKIIKPEAMVFQNGKPVGYQMPFIKDTVTLCQLFTSTFKQRNNISQKQVADLIRDMANTLRYTHSKNVLVVDLNELNCLADKTFSSVFYIDVDSWQTQGYQATAIMPTVRDYHTKGFNEGSDWFSFAVVTYQMLVGIHPYRGKYPGVPELEDRMKQNISVLSPGVKVPPCCQGLIPIDTRYLQWYRDVFNHEWRNEFPTDNFMINVVSKQPIPVNGKSLTIEELYRAPYPILNYGYTANCEVLLTTKNVIINRAIKTKTLLGDEISFWQNIPFSVRQTSSCLEITNLQNLQIVQTTNRPVDGFFISGQRIYIKYEDNIYESQFHQWGKEIDSVWRIVARVMPNATKLYSGVAIQNMLGRWVADLFPSEGKHFQILLPQLDGYVIQDASAIKDLLIIIASKNGKYDRFMFKISGVNIIQTVVVQDVTYTSINFVYLDRGVVVLMNEDGDLELFSINDISKRRLIQDSCLNGNMKLVTDGAVVMAILDNLLLKLTMK